MSKVRWELYFSPEHVGGRADVCCHTGLNPNRPVSCLHHRHAVPVMCACVWTCVCMWQHTCLFFTPPPTTTPSSFTWPPQQHFHIDSSARPVGQCNHRAAAGKDKNRVYFPPKHFSVKRQPENQKGDSEDCQIEPYGAHCCTADERILIASCKGQNTAATNRQKSVNSWSHCEASSFAASFEALGIYSYGCCVWFMHWFCHG